MRRFVALFVLILTVVTAASCGREADPAELYAAMEELAPRAYELYGVIYGDTVERSSEPEANGYYRVTDGVYSSETAIRSALEEVFTEGYAKVLCNTAFMGVSSDEGAIGSKFRTEMDGLFVVKPSVTAHFAAPRAFDLSTCEVVQQNPYRAVVSVAALSDGSRVEVVLQRSRDGWRIDSALF